MESHSHECHSVFLRMIKWFFIQQALLIFCVLFHWIYISFVSFPIVLIRSDDRADWGYIRNVITLVFLIQSWANCHHLFTLSPFCDLSITIKTVHLIIWYFVDIVLYCGMHFTPLQLIVLGSKWMVSKHWFWYNSCKQVDLNVVAVIGDNAR